MINRITLFADNAVSISSYFVVVLFTSVEEAGAYFSLALDFDVYF